MTKKKLLTAVISFLIGTGYFGFSTYKWYKKWNVPILMSDWSDHAMHGRFSPLIEPDNKEPGSLLSGSAAKFYVLDEAKQDVKQHPIVATERIEALSNLRDTSKVTLLANEAERFLGKTCDHTKNWVLVRAFSPNKPSGLNSDLTLDFNDQTVNIHTSVFGWDEVEIAAILLESTKPIDSYNYGIHIRRGDSHHWSLSQRTANWFIVRKNAASPP